MNTISLASSCIDRDLLVTPEGETVRFLAFDEAIQMISVTMKPCKCTNCIVGYTRHGAQDSRLFEPESLVFPRYSNLRYWDQDSPVTRLFRVRAGRKLSDMVDYQLVFDSDGIKLHT
jgi:hypothetical protein